MGARCYNQVDGVAAGIRNDNYKRSAPAVVRLVQSLRALVARDVIEVGDRNCNCYYVPMDDDQGDVPRWFTQLSGIIERSEFLESRAREHLNRTVFLVNAGGVLVTFGIAGTLLGRPGGDPGLTVEPAACFVGGLLFSVLHILIYPWLLRRVHALAKLSLGMAQGMDQRGLFSRDGDPQEGLQLDDEIRSKLHDVAEAGRPLKIAIWLDRVLPALALASFFSGVATGFWKLYF